MKLYVTFWQENTADDADIQIERAVWTTSQGDASKAATAAKKELRDSDSGDPKTVKLVPVEIDTRKEGLVSFLNNLGNGAGVAAAIAKLTA